MQQPICSWYLGVLLTFWGLSIHGSNAHPTIETSLSPRTIPLPLAVTIVHTFEFPSWCENLAVQANGLLLITRMDTPEVIQIDPTGVLAPITIASFNTTEYMGCLGISETVPGVFYVVTAAFINTTTFVKTSGMNSIWEIDMNTFNISSDDGVVTSNATVTKIVDIPDADFLNGMVTLDTCHILVGDANNGWVYKVDVETGEYQIAIDDPLMKYGESGTTDLGVNGLKIRDSYLYWTNTAAGSFNRILIDAAGEPVGVSEVVSANVPRPDDFVFKSDGTAFIAQNQLDELSVVFAGNSIAEVVAGNNISTTLAGVTAGKFGRLSSDADRLYLTTNGALALPINGTVVVPGSVVYIDTTGF